MTNAVLNLGTSNQIADVTTGNVTGGDSTNTTVSYEGVPFDQVAGLLTRFLDKQPQLQQLLLAAIESIQDSLHAFGARIDRFALILVWIASALTGLTLVLTILLVVVLGSLFRFMPQIAGL